jgi:hypothetical protein
MTCSHPSDGVFDPNQVESLLEKAQLDERSFMPLIKEIGSARGGGDVEKLDWLWVWAKKQTGLTLNVFHYNVRLNLPLAGWCAGCSAQ